LRERLLPWEEKGGVYLVPLKHTTEAIAIVDGCRDNIAGLEIANGTMDDVFLQLTGKEIRG
jgi:multidrug/hemolysin transport system ATP-binding protein